MIGLTGPNASGKGEVSSYLGRLGFARHSLSDVVRDEAARRGLPSEREHLIRVGNSLREAGGAGVLAEIILPRLGRRDVVDSIRNPAEVAVLRRLPHFLLVGVRAALDVRFDRSRRRARPGDPSTVEEFVARELQEEGERSTAQQLGATFRLADLVVDNDGDLEPLHAAVDRLVADAGG